MRLRRVVTLAGGFAVLVALVWFAGFGAAYAVVIATAIAVVVLAWSDLPDGDVSARWPSRAVAPDGVRDDLERLTWQLGTSRGPVGEGAVRQVRALAAARLARRRLDLDDPADRAAVEALLGPAVYRALCQSTRPTLAALVRCLDAIDGIADPAAPRPSGAPHER